MICGDAQRVTHRVRRRKSIIAFERHALVEHICKRRVDVPINLTCQRQWIGFAIHYRGGPAEGVRRLHVGN
jgi:hypothetical protein